MVTSLWSEPILAEKQRDLSMGQRILRSMKPVVRFVGGDLRLDVENFDLTLRAISAA